MEKTIREIINRQFVDMAKIKQSVGTLQTACRLYLDLIGENRTHQMIREQVAQYQAIAADLGRHLGVYSGEEIAESIGALGRITARIRAIVKESRKQLRFQFRIQRKIDVQLSRVEALLDMRRSHLPDIIAHFAFIALLILFIARMFPVFLEILSVASAEPFFVYMRVAILFLTMLFLPVIVIVLLFEKIGAYAKQHRQKDYLSALTYTNIVISMLNILVNFLDRLV